MLTLYKPPGKDDDEEKEGISVEEYRKVIPPWKPYLTTVNGKVAFARDKPKRTNSTKSKTGINLLGEAFGLKIKTVHHQRAKSVAEPVNGAVVLEGVGVGYVQQDQAVPYTVPMPQQGFPVPAMGNMGYWPYYPQGFYPPPPPPQVPVFSKPEATPKPSESDLKLLLEFEADVEKRSMSKGKAKADEAVQESQKIEAEAKTEEKQDNTVQLSHKARVLEVKTTITLAMHVCANCRKVRSRKFHAENPIKPGDTPPPMFCRRCQKDASSTSAPDSEVEDGKKNRKKKKESKKPDKGKEPAEKKEPEKSDKGKGKETAESKKPTVESDNEQDDASSASLKQMCMDVLKRIEKKKDKKLKKEKSPQKPNVTFESPTTKENQQPRRKKHSLKVQVDPDIEPRPRSASNRSKRAAHSPTRSRHSEAGNAASERTRKSSHLPIKSHQSEARKSSDTPSLPPKVKGHTDKHEEAHPPSIQHHMVFEDDRVHHRDFADKGAREEPVDSVERHPQEGRRHSSKQGRVPSRDRSSIRHHDGGTRPRKDSRANEADSDKLHHSKMHQSQDSTHSSHRSFHSSRGSNRGYLANSDSNRAETGYDISEYSSSQRSSQISSNRHSSPIRMAASGPERAPNWRPDSSDTSRQHLRQDSKASDSGQSSQSTASHSVLKRSSSTNHSTPSVRHRRDSHGPEKRSEQHTTKKSTRSSSEPSTIKEHRQQRNTSLFPVPDAGWTQGWNFNNLAKNPDTKSSKRDTSDHQKDKSTYHERDSAAGSHGGSERRRMSRANSSSSRLSDHASTITPEEIPFNSFRSERPSKTPVFHGSGHSEKKDDKSSSSRSVKDHYSSSFPRDRHRRRSEQTVHSETPFEPPKPSSRRSTAASERSSDRKERRISQSRSEQDAYSKRSDLRRGEEDRSENGFSATDAAKHFRNDWTNDKSDSRHSDRQGSERKSSTSNSERSFTTADASKYYQKNWVASEDSQNSEGMKTPKQAVHSEESDPTSSEIKRYFKGSDEVPPNLPPPPLFIIKEADEGALQVSPIRRHFASSQGGHHEAPSTIWEMNEHAHSAPASIHGLGLGMSSNPLDPRSASSSRHSSRELVSLQNSRATSQQSSPIVGSVSEAESVVHTPAKDGDEVADSSLDSDVTIGPEKMFDQGSNVEGANGGTRTQATSFEDAALAKAAENGWFTPTESQLEKMARQDAVPGFGLGNLTDEDAENGSPALGWGDAAVGESSEQDAGKTDAQTGFGEGAQEKTADQGSSEKADGSEKEDGNGREGGSKKGDGQAEGNGDSGIGKEETGDQDGGTRGGGG